MRAWRLAGGRGEQSSHLCEGTRVALSGPPLVLHCQGGVGGWSQSDLCQEVTRLGRMAARVTVRVRANLRPSEASARFILPAAAVVRSVLLHRVDEEADTGLSHCPRLHCWQLAGPGTGRQSALGWRLGLEAVGAQRVAWLPPVKPGPACPTWVPPRQLGPHLSGRTSPVWPVLTYPACPHLSGLSSLIQHAHICPAWPHLSSLAPPVRPGSTCPACPYLSGLAPPVRPAPPFWPGSTCPA